MADSRKHHHVPQSLLRQFSIDGAREQVAVFDKTRRMSFVSSIADAGCESSFNTVEVEGRRLSFEQLFQINDDELGKVLTLLTESRNLASLDRDRRNSLVEIVAVQLIRTKMWRTTMLEVAAQLRDAVLAAGFDTASLDMPAENDARLAALSSFLECSSLAASFRDKDVLLIGAEGSRPLWISDNPVVVHNSFPYGELGLKSPGVEIYMPVSSELAIAFLCPSIGRRLSTAVGSGVPQHLRERFATIRYGLDSGNAVSLGVETCTFLNALQVHQSSRFIYGAWRDFELAQAIIERQPKLREIRSRLRVGRLGQGPPPRRMMPHGYWLVTYGREDHHLIYIDKWIAKSAFIEFVTSDLGSLYAAASDVPLVQVELFEDGQARRGMREVRLEITGGGGSRHVIVKHSDDGLNAIAMASAG